MDRQIIAAILMGIVNLTALPVLADDVNKAVVPPAADCTLIQNAHLSVNFTGSEKEAAAIQKKFDAKIAEIKQLAKDAGLSTFEVQSMNYSIGTHNNNDSDNEYRFHGSASFTLAPVEKAAKFVDSLTQKGYKANLNVNSYRNCNPNNDSNLLRGAIENTIVKPVVAPVPLPSFIR